MLTVEGRGADRTTYVNVEEAEKKAAEFNDTTQVEQELSCYRLENPKKWYIRGITQN